MVTRIGPNPFKRMTACMVGQAKNALSCPVTPRLDGKLALITGPTSGIGEATAFELAERGAEILLFCRNRNKAEALTARLMAAGQAHDKLHIIDGDLADLTTLGPAMQQIERALKGRRLDILIENAGVWARRFQRTQQGHEVSFGVNVLGHFALRRLLLNDYLADHARVICLTGDIYVLADMCTADFNWSGPLGGMKAYCRSKLGNFWIARQLQFRHPQLNVFIVHPGVAATALGGDYGGMIDRLKTRMFITPRQAAQTTLLCASQPDVAHGSYYHNVFGETELSHTDPAMNDEAGARLWLQCEGLADHAGAKITPLRSAS